MKNAIAIIFLIIVILTVGSYCILYISFNLTDQNNSINQIYRKKILQIDWLRTALRLHQIGDARFDYATSKKYTRLQISIFAQENLSLDPQTMPKVISEMKRVIDKPGGISIEDPVIIDENLDKYNDHDLALLLKKYQTGINWFSSAIPLRIFILKKYAITPSFAGLVQEADSIFIFADAIHDVSDLQTSVKNVEVSTLLHEFAHLLGANHIDGNDCILSEKVENTTFFNLPSVITDSYCNMDIEEINRAIN